MTVGRSLLLKSTLLVRTLVVLAWLQGSQEPQAGPEPSRPAAQVLQAPGTVMPAPSPPEAVKRPPPHTRRLSASPSSTPHVGLLDVNRASREQLEALPGIGPVLAQRIVDWRRAHGAFRKIEDLLEIKGIGAKKLERVQTLIAVHSTPAAGPAGITPRERSPDLDGSHEPA